MARPGTRPGPFLTLLSLLVTAGVELETVSSRRVMPQKARALLSSTDLAKEQALPHTEAAAEVAEKSVAVSAALEEVDAKAAAKMKTAEKVPDELAGKAAKSELKEAEAVEREQVAHAAGAAPEAEAGTTKRQQERILLATRAFARKELQEVLGAAIPLKEQLETAKALEAEAHQKLADAKLRLLSPKFQLTQLQPVRESLRKQMSRSKEFTEVMPEWHRLLAQTAKVHMQLDGQNKVVAVAQAAADTADAKLMALRGEVFRRNVDQRNKKLNELKMKRLAEEEEWKERAIKKNEAAVPVARQKHAEQNQAHNAAATEKKVAETALNCTRKLQWQKAEGDRTFEAQQLHSNRNACEEAGCFFAPRDPEDGLQRGPFSCCRPGSQDEADMCRRIKIDAAKPDRIRQILRQKGRPEDRDKRMKMLAVRYGSTLAGNVTVG